MQLSYVAIRNVASGQTLPPNVIAMSCLPPHLAPTYGLRTRSRREYQYAVMRLGMHVQGILSAISLLINSHRLVRPILAGVPVAIQNTPLVLYTPTWALLTLSVSCSLVWLRPIRVPALPRSRHSRRRVLQPPNRCRYLGAFPAVSQCGIVKGACMATPAKSTPSAPRTAPCASSSRLGAGFNALAQHLAELRRFALTLSTLPSARAARPAASP